MDITLSTAFLFLLTATAAFTDLRFQRIYNWTTYTGILVALAVNLFENGWDDGIPGHPGLQDSLIGFAACGGLMLVSYVFFSGIGGGDVKLISMVGAFLGLEKGFDVVLWTFVLGGAASLIVLIWRVGLFRLIVGSVRHVFWSLRLANWLPLSEAERRELQQRLRLAPAAAVAIVIVCFNLVRI